uniref:Uncharacterized protein n=1 Tax=Candidatus Desulfatibia profunda TaxID=2841695 RepID=A0A8J6NQ76_9BACT|nr:hypothetical protein [Candidatus Desulfatibia profunda]
MDRFNSNSWGGIAIITASCPGARPPIPIKILLDVFSCRYVSGEVKLNGSVDYRWITHDEIDQYPFPKANHKFIPLLLPGR